MRPAWVPVPAVVSWPFTKAKDQAEQVRQASAKLEKAYAQVQEIAVRAIEGASGGKALAAGLQQMVAEQSRRGEGKQ